MKTVRQFTFPLDHSEVRFGLAKNDQILSVQMVGNHAAINVLIEDNTTARTLLETPEQRFTAPAIRSLRILRTGEHIYEYKEDTLRFIGTIQPINESEACHIFEVMP